MTEKKHITGRIIKGVGGLYTVWTHNNVYECSARGIFRNKNITPLIGDFVEIEIWDSLKNKATIEKINERKNMLIRPKVSNIDQAIIVFSLKEPDINIELLDKFLVMAEERNVEALVCFNKTDLIKDGFHIKLKDMYEKIGYNVVLVSALQSQGIRELNSYISGKVSVFAGPSGVGKSSIVNGIFPKAQMETGEISKKIKRGRHTTRHAQLIQLDENSFVVDSPGFTTLSIDNISKEQLPFMFREFRQYEGLCRFTDCLHIKEPHCAVKEHVDKEIFRERYERYLRFSAEIEEQ